MKITKLGMILVLALYCIASAAEPPGLHPVYQDGKASYIDRTGKLVIEPRFDRAEDFAESMGAVLLNGKWGFMDATGNVVITPQFDEVGQFYEGLCAVRTGDKWTFVDKAGSLVGKDSYDSVLPFSQGLAAVKVGGKWGFVNREARMVIKPTFDGAWSFNDGLAPVKLGGKWGYVDKTGKVVIKPQYFWAECFSDGLAYVQGRSGNEGYIDTSGKFVIQRRFYEANPFAEGIAAVRFESDGQFCLIDKQGKKVSDAEFYLAGMFSEGRMPVLRDNLWGYADRAGKMAIEFKFTSDNPFRGGLALVSIEDGKLGYIDAAGKFVWGPEPPGDLKATADLPAPPTFEAKIAGPASVPAKEVTCIGNPYRQRFPDDGQNVFSRNIWDMHLFDGRIYIGGGDFWVNTGPADIYSFAPGEEKFALEYTAADEMVSRFFDYEGRLVVPGNDPRESWELGNLYIKEFGKWFKVRTLPKGIHCWHVAYLDGKLYTRIPTSGGGGAFLASDDWGRSWKPIVFNAPHLTLMTLFTHQGKVHGFDWENNVHTLEGDVLACQGNLPPKYETLTGRVPDTFHRYTFRDAVSFGKGVVLITHMLGNPEYGPYPLFYMESLDKTPSAISVFMDARVMDILLRGNTLYALSTGKSEQGWENKIYSTRDMRSWKCAATFTTESFARSFEEAKGVFYVGIGCSGPYPENAPKSTGDILRVTVRKQEHAR